MKALELNVERKYSSNRGRFSFVAGKGSFSGMSGVVVRSKHGMSSSSHEAAALVGRLSTEEGSSTGAACDLDTPGNPLGRSPSSNKAFSERYKPRVFRDTWTIWRVILPATSIRRRTAPLISRDEFVIPTMRCFVGTVYDSGIPICSNTSVPAVHVWQHESANAEIVCEANVPRRLPFQ